MEGQARLRLPHLGFRSSGGVEGSRDVYEFGVLPAAPNGARYSTGSGCPRRHCRYASMMSPMSLSSTASTLPLACRVRSSLTSWYGCNVYVRIWLPNATSRFSPEI